MPLIQGGPPEWVWERTTDFLQTEVVPVSSPHGLAVYELRRHFFTREELRALAAQLAAVE